MPRASRDDCKRDEALRTKRAARCRGVNFQLLNMRRLAGLIAARRVLSRGQTSLSALVQGSLIAAFTLLRRNAKPRTLRPAENSLSHCANLIGTWSWM